MSRALTLLALVLLFLAGACNMNYVEHMTSLSPLKAENLPPIQIDREASLIAVTETVDRDGFERNKVLGGVEAFWNAKASRGTPLPARVLISGSARQDNAIVAFCMLAVPVVGPLLGLPCSKGVSKLDVVIEIKGRRRFMGTGEGTCWAGLYYPGEPDQCALSKALTDAIRKATVEAE